MGHNIYNNIFMVIKICILFTIESLTGRKQKLYISPATRHGSPGTEKAGEDL
jgi:hypothetical protein